MRTHLLPLLLLAAPVLVFGAEPQSLLRAAVYRGHTVYYQTVGPYAVVEGDIILGTVAEMESGALASVEPAARKSSDRDSITLNGAMYRWPSATIPYEIDDALANPQRVLDAVQYWNTNTPLKLTPRSGQANYVRFTPATFDAACSSSIGMRGGEQTILITDGCTSGALIHEIGHAFGLLHEQTRADRNAFLTVLYQNLDKRYYGDFDQLLGATTDTGYYDYDSIMHYAPQGFSNNGKDALATVPLGIPIGQRTHLSPGDLDSVSRLYGFTPTATTITTVPIGLTIVVDGATAVSPQSYSWAPGSSHTLAVDGVQQGGARYAFVRWSDGLGPSHSVVASAGSPTVYCATYTQQDQVSIGVASGQGTATLAPTSPDGYYNDRTEIRVEARPASGFEFLRWTGTTNFSANSYGVSTPVAVLAAGLPTGNYTAAFTQSPTTTITSDPLGRSVSIDGTTYLTPAKFAWAPGSSHQLSVTATQMFGNNTARFQFQFWNDSADSDRTILAKNESTTYTASFTTQYLVSTVTTGSGQITLTPSSPDGFYNAGTVLQAEAKPAAGSIFFYWLGDGAGGSPTLSVPVTEQRMLIAHFNTVPLPFRVLSAASFLANPRFTASGTVVSPGEIVTIFGPNLGPSTLTPAAIDVTGKLSTKVAGIRILFNGSPAPIVYVSANQSSVIVPYAVSGSTNALVQIENQGVITATDSVSVGATAPALFTADSSGKGQLAALNQDGSVNSPANPAPHGSVVVLFATGEGMTNPVVADGTINQTVYPKPAAPAYVRVGKLPAAIQYVGAAPGEVAGLLQVNIQLPDQLLPGSAIPIQLSLGSFASPPGTTIAAQ